MDIKVFITQISISVAINVYSNITIHMKYDDCICTNKNVTGTCLNGSNKTDTVGVFFAILLIQLTNIIDSKNYLSFTIILLMTLMVHKSYIDAKKQKNNKITNIIPNDTKYYTNVYDHKMSINNCYFANNDCMMIRLQCITLLKMTGVLMIFV